MGFCGNITSPSSIAAFRWRRHSAAARFCHAARKNLDLIFSLQFERTVNRDNTVSFQNLQLQIERVHWRGTLAGCNVMVHQHLDGTISLTHGPHRLGRYDAQGVALTANKNVGGQRCGKDAPWKSPKTDFSPRLEIPPSARDSHFPTAPTATAI